MKCIGTLGTLSTAKDKGLIKELRPIFKALINNDRYYSLKLLNILLERHNELKIKHNA